MVKEELIGTIVGLIFAIIAAAGIVLHITYMFIVPIGVGFIVIFTTIVLSFKAGLRG